MCKRVSRRFALAASCNTLKSANYGRAFIPPIQAPTGVADLPCPNCGSPLAFLDQYQRHYCLRCGQYAPEGYGDRGAKHCPTCGGILSYVSRYDRFYCYHCNLYAPEETAAPPTPSSPHAESPAVASQPTPPETAKAEPAAAPSTPEATPAAAGTAAPVPPTTPATPEPSPTPAALPETTPSTPVLPASTAPETPAAQPPAEPIPQEPSPEIQKLAASKPAVVRVKIFTLKKSELIDLCKTYSLDPSGTKEQVQERLLSYLHDLESEETPSEEPRASLEPTPRAIEPTPAPASAPAAKLEPMVSRASAATLAAPAAAAVVIPVEAPQPEPATEAPPQESAPVEVSRAPPKIEHPCPTCGRELTFIAQYDRYYCYFCQRYAPVTRVKGACPTCGATMRWIDQHQRWWCDSCQKYASADLPKPTNGAAAVPRAVAATTAVTAARPAVVIHHHASPAVGMGLIGLGLALWIIVEFFTVLAPAMSLAINNPFTGSLGSVTVFFAFIFVAAGALLGLSNLRDRF